MTPKFTHTHNATKWNRHISATLSRILSEMSSQCKRIRILSDYPPYRFTLFHGMIF
jgi:hypothetical protein